MLDALKIEEGERRDRSACFVGTSDEIPGVRMRATVLIEVRPPRIDPRRTAGPPMRQLLDTGQCRPLPQTPESGPVTC